MKTPSRWDEFVEAIGLPSVGEETRRNAYETYDALRRMNFLEPDLAYVTEWGSVLAVWNMGRVELQLDVEGGKVSWDWARVD